MSTPDELDFLNRVKQPSPKAQKLQAAFSELSEMLSRLEQLVVPELLLPTTNLVREVDKFAVRASLIGQVKAGKTALTNALLGTADLLPSDVNPWTSVVTSVHLNQKAPNNRSAIFRFFNRNDWDAMVATGGRIAKMAKEAKMDTEADDLRDQIVEMQERTTKRLGKNFELLLGGHHAFSDFDSELIKRYVCLGEEDDAQSREGRFADLTKSADLYMDSGSFDYPITFADTPGVNDPFLVREAVTLESLGQSDICVIVLSAHQALSTTDLALMRILINLKHEQIVLFVNRVDELANPQEQIEEINRHIRETLATQSLPASIPVVFGSAAWAEAQISGSLDVLPDASVEALATLVEARSEAAFDASNLIGLRDLSGLSALQSVLDQKATDDICVPFAASIARRASDLALQSRAILTKTASMSPTAVRSGPLEIGEIEARVDAFLTQVDEKFDAIRSKYAERMTFEMSGAFNGFIFRESRELASHIEGRGRLSDWSPDAEGLRRSLNTVYGTVSKEMLVKIEHIYLRTHQIFETLYEQLTGEKASELGLSAPVCANPATPISLMRTMSVDLASGWITNWLTRRIQKETYLKKFKDVTVEQMRSTLDEVREKHIEEFLDMAQANLQEFVDTHLGNLRCHARLDSVEERAELRRKLGSADSVDARIAELSDHIAEFEHIMSWLAEDDLGDKRIA